LNPQALAQANEPMRLYLSCLRVLQAWQDPRANALLMTAYQLLQERAAKLPDEAGRQAFLHGIPSNRALLREYAQSTITPRPLTCRFTRVVACAASAEIPKR